MLESVRDLNARADNPRGPWSVRYARITLRLLCGELAGGAARTFDTLSRTGHHAEAHILYEFIEEFVGAAHRGMSRLDRLTDRRSGEK